MLIAAIKSWACKLAPFLFLLGSVSSSTAQQVLNADFESDPAEKGWVTGGPSATWSFQDKASGQSCLSIVSNQWSSPLIATKPLQWYRLTFLSKTTGKKNNPGGSGYGYWSATYVDGKGQALNSDQYSAFMPSPDWVTNTFHIRAKVTVDSDGKLQPCQLRIGFHPIHGAPFFIDNVELTETHHSQAREWADKFYATLPPLAYQPSQNRFRNLPQTISKLFAGSTLRVLMLGDSVQQDTSNSPWELWVEKFWPGSKIEVICSTRGSTGVDFYKDHVEERIARYRPDLLIIGGISNGTNMAHYASVIDQARASGRKLGKEPEVLILTGAWSPNSFPNPNAYFFAPNLVELDPNPVRNLSAPLGFQIDLANLASLKQCGFLDMTAVSSAYIYCPAKTAGFGPPDPKTGQPYDYWMRDTIHGNDRAKLIMGKILATFFQPIR